MNTSQPLLLALWREVGRHAALGESAAQLLKLLGPHLPVEALVLVHLLPESQSAEVMLHQERGASAQPAEPLRFAESQFANLKRWCARREVSRGLPSSLVGLDLGAVEREVLAAPLHGGGEATGVALLVAPARKHFTQAEQKLVATLPVSYTHLTLPTNREV